MRRITRMFRICFIFFFLLQGCTPPSSNKKHVDVNPMVVNKKHREILKSNYGDTKRLIRQAMLKVDKSVSTVEEVETIEESKQKGLYFFANYQIESTLNIEKGIDKAQLSLVVKKIGMPLLKERKYDFNVFLEDVEAPQITLKESQCIIFESERVQFEEYIETIHDNLDEEVREVEISNPIPKVGEKWQVGEYDICYRAWDKHKNKAEKILRVKVIEDKIEDEPVMLPFSETKMSILAQSLIGKPYVWGAKGPDSFDCSGIIMYIYQCLQKELSWTQIQYGIGTSISLDPSAWQEGDVLSYMDNSKEIVHHALYLGNGLALHAMVNGVQIVPIDTQMESGPNNPQRIVRVTRYI